MFTKRALNIRDVYFVDVPYKVPWYCTVGKSVSLGLHKRKEHWWPLLRNGDEDKLFPTYPILVEVRRVWDVTSFLRLISILQWKYNYK